MPKLLLILFIMTDSLVLADDLGSIIYPDQVGDRARPSLSGPESLITKPHIVVHYTLEGEDSTTFDYAESVAVYAETSWVRTERLGWYMPAPDGNEGGDSLYDFYIECSANIGYPGLTWPDDPYTNPFTDGYTAYTEITSEATDWDYLMSLTAHEFHHGAQKRYSAWESMWWYENTSVFMEDIIYEHVNNLPGLLWNSDPSPLLDPYCAIREDQGAYEYAAGLWAHFLHEYYGMSAMLRIWERCGSHSGNHSIADMNWQLENYFDSDLEKAVSHYAIWRYFCGARDIEDHFEEGGSYPSANILRSHSTYPATGDQGFEPLDGPGGCNFIEFTNFADNRLDIFFAGESGYSWEAYVLGFNIYDSFYYEYKIPLDTVQDTGRVSVPCWDYSTIVLVPINATWETNTYNLDFSYDVSLITDYTNVEERHIEWPFDINFQQNPGRLPVKIILTIPVDIDKVSVIIFDITGREVRTFRNTTSNRHLIWDGYDNRGRLVQDGLYFCVLSTDHVQKCKKVMLIK
ncbi:MAG: hypothetical protein WBB37_09875 [bacterium]